MKSLVLELQAEALDSNVPVADLLRKALVVARKLNIPALQEWCESELKGYSGPGTEVPSYRKMEGRLMAHNPYRGWIPVMFKDPEVAGVLSKRDLGAPVLVMDGHPRNADLDLSWEQDTLVITGGRGQVFRAESEHDRYVIKFSGIDTEGGRP